MEAALSTTGSTSSFAGGPVSGSISVGGALDVVGTTTLANANVQRSLNIGPALTQTCIGGIAPSAWYRFDGNLTDSISSTAMTVTTTGIAYSPKATVFPYATLSAGFVAYATPGITFTTTSSPLTISFYANMNIATGGLMMSIDNSGTITELARNRGGGGSNNPVISLGSASWYKTPALNTWVHIMIVIPTANQAPKIYYDGVLQVYSEFLTAMPTISECMRRAWRMHKMVCTPCA